jgi:hypothetical protein
MSPYLVKLQHLRTASARADPNLRFDTVDAVNVTTFRTPLKTTFRTQFGEFADLFP